MSDIASGFVGFAVGVFVTLMVSANFGIAGTWFDRKQECEKNLPRNQVCVMQAVPEVK